VSSFYVAVVATNLEGKLQAHNSEMQREENLQIIARDNTRKLSLGL
jgi:hypothetical protein